MRVTAFKTYLVSPYLFYLQHVQGLETVIEEHELSPLAFGSLVHDVLEAFGRDAALRASTDAAAIEAFLHERLQAFAATRYGDTALPAVAVQLVQLRRRLSDFAVWQAGRTREGWRIRAVEWTPPGEEWPFEVDGRPMRLRGRIDRIDVHADGRWALLDYKTSEREASKLDPESNHQRGGRWIDLQLPLYRLIAQPLAAEQGWTRPPELGYVVLPGEREQTGERMAEWSEADLEAAWEVARQVVRDVRAGRFAELGDFPEDEPELAWIAGRGLLAAQAAAPDGDEEEEW
jgi:RecB family exonuclease